MNKLRLYFVMASALIFGLIPALSTGQELFIYPPAAAPVVDADPSIAMPLAVGPVATGAANVNLSVSTTAFAAPMDFFVGVFAPSVLGPSEIFLVMPDNSLQPLSVVGVAPWRSGVTQVNESLYGDIPSNLLPAGMYNLFFMATPAGNQAIFTLWQTWFGAGQVIQVRGTSIAAEETVPPIVTSAVGIGDLTVVLNTGEVASTQRFSGLTSGVVDAHIHNGPEGTRGPVILGFQGPIGGTSGTWSAPLGATLPPEEITALQNNLLYYQVHTSTNPAGEIRGQIIFSDSSSPPPPAEVTITTQLSGAQAVPPVATPGTGTAISTFNLSTGAITGSLTFSGLTGNSILAHIHIGAAGTNGGVIVDMAGGAGGTSGTWTFPAGSTLTPAEITALQNNGLYYQVHSSTFPGGELRGQIIFP